MAKQKFGLGRGLDALISGAAEVMASQQPSRVDEQSILLVAIDSIMPNPRQPRKIFREDDPKLLELSASIKEHGLLQPLVVTRLDGNAAPDDATGKATSQADSWFGAGTVDNRVGSASVQAEKTGVVRFQITGNARTGPDREYPAGRPESD